MTRPLFEQLEPPPGGLARLRARIHAPGPSWPEWMPVPAIAATLVITVIGTWLLAPPQVDLLQRIRTDPGALSIGPGSLTREPVTIAAEQRGTTALMRVATSSPDVIFYRVSSTEWRADSQ